MAPLCSSRLWDPCSLSLGSPTSLATPTQLPWMVPNPAPSARLRPFLSLTFPRDLKHVQGFKYHL